MKNRIISMILAVSLCLSLAISVLPSASAAYDYEPQGSLYSILEKAVVNFWGEKLGLSFDAEDFQKFSRSCFSETGLVASLDVLYDICEDYNNSYRSVPKLAASGLEANSIFSLLVLKLLMIMTMEFIVFGIPIRGVGLLIIMVDFPILKLSPPKNEIIPLPLPQSIPFLSFRKLTALPLRTSGFLTAKLSRIP